MSRSEGVFPGITGAAPADIACTSRARVFPRVDVIDCASSNAVAAQGIESKQLDKVGGLACGARSSNVTETGKLKILMHFFLGRPHHIWHHTTWSAVGRSY